jgi:hypothetical protein
VTILRYVMAASDVPLVHKLDAPTGWVVDGLLLRPGWMVLAVAERCSRDNGTYQLDSDGITLRREPFQWYEGACVQVAAGVCYERTWWIVTTPEPIYDRVTPLVFCQCPEDVAKGRAP